MIQPVARPRITRQSKPAWAQARQLSSSTLQLQGNPVPNWQDASSIAQLLVSAHEAWPTIAGGRFGPPLIGSVSSVGIVLADQSTVSLATVLRRHSRMYQKEPRAALTEAELISGLATIPPAKAVSLDYLFWVLAQTKPGTLDTTHWRRDNPSQSMVVQLEAGVSLALGGNASTIMRAVWAQHNFAVSDLPLYWVVDSTSQTKVRLTEVFNAFWRSTASALVRSGALAPSCKKQTSACQFRADIMYYQLFAKPRPLARRPKGFIKLPVGIDEFLPPLLHGDGPVPALAWLRWVAHLKQIRSLEAFPGPSALPKTIVHPHSGQHYAYSVLLRRALGAFLRQRRTQGDTDPYAREIWLPDHLVNRAANEWRVVPEGFRLSVLNYLRRHYDIPGRPAVAHVVRRGPQGRTKSLVNTGPRRRNCGKG